MLQGKLSREEALEEYIVYRKRLRELLDLAQIARDIKEGKYQPRDLRGRGPDRFSHAVGNALVGLFASLIDPQEHALNVFDVWVVLFPEKKDRITETWKTVEPHVQLIRDYRNDIVCHANKNLRRQAQTYLNYHKHFRQIVEAMQKVSHLAAELLRDEPSALPKLRSEMEAILDQALAPPVTDLHANQSQVITELKRYFLPEEWQRDSGLPD